MKPLGFDDFLPDFAAARERAMAAPFFDYASHDGETYKRVWLGEVPDLRACLEAKVGPVEMLGMGYRLNYDGELPNNAVHSDLGWGTHALVLYFNPGPGGTAFHRHKATGAKSIAVGDHDLLAQIDGDWNDLDAWEMHDIVLTKPNRCTVFSSRDFHSRYPFAAFGTTPADGRLIAVAFFNLLREPA